jgi:hypothetical protein
MTAALINAELGRAANAAFSLDGAQERALAGKPSGALAFSDFYGKSNGIPGFGWYDAAGNPVTGNDRVIRGIGYSWQYFRFQLGINLGGSRNGFIYFNEYVGGPGYWNLNAVANNDYEGRVEILVVDGT